MTIEYKDSKRIVKLSTDIDSISNPVTTTQALSNEYTQASSSANPSGQVFKAGAALIGETITEFTFGLRTVGGSGTRTGTITMGIFSETDDSLIKSFRTIAWSDLTTTDTDYTATGIHVLAADQVVGIQWVGTGNGEVAFYSQNTQVYDGTNSYVQEKGNGNTARDAKFQIKTGTPVYKPTNVQDNSILIEKDTVNRYWFTKGTTITEETLDSTNGTASWNVSNGGSDITIDTGNNEIDITGTGQKSGYYDLGASISASAWTLRFKIASSGSPTGNPLFWVGMFDVNTIDSRGSTNVDGISVMMYTGGNYKLSMKNGTPMDQGGSQTDMSPTVSADTTTRYVEIVRDGSNAILTFYDSDTYTTSIGTVTVAITGSAFRYLCAISYWEGSGRTYSLSNVKFYNGATSVTPTAWTKGHVNPAWTVDQNFSSSTGWTFTNTSGTYWNIASNKLNWRVDIARSGSGANYDLTTGQSVSNLDSYDAWLLRFELTLDTAFGRNHDALCNFGIHDNDDFGNPPNNGDYDVSHAQVQIQVSINDLQNNLKRFQAIAENSDDIGQDQTINNDITMQSKYFIEIKKTDATTYVVGYSLNSDYTTSQTVRTVTSLTLSGLKYLHFEAWEQGNNSSYESWGQGWLENLKFYAGVSSL